MTDNEMERVKIALEKLQENFDEWKFMEDCPCINCQRVIREREST